MNFDYLREGINKWFHMPQEEFEASVEHRNRILKHLQTDTTNKGKDTGYVDLSGRKILVGDMVDIDYSESSNWSDRDRKDVVLVGLLDEVPVLVGDINFAPFSNYKTYTPGQLSVRVLP